MSTTVTCPTCRAAVAPRSSFCTRCGAVLHGVPEGAAADRAAGSPWSSPTGWERPARVAQRRGDGPDALGADFGGTALASVGRRLAAYALDLAAVGAVAVAVLLGTRSGLLTALAAVEAVTAVVLWEARTGRTPGNLLLGLRSAREEAPWAPGLGRAVARAAVVGAANVVPAAGGAVVVASAAWDRSGRRQGWHDRLARTQVLDTRTPPTPHIPNPQPSAPRTPALPDDLGGGVEPVVEPAVPAAVAAVASVATTWVVTLDDGRAMSVSGPGYVGRRPQPTAGERCDHVIEIDDPGRSLSRTHAAFGIDAAGFWVADHGSANGTAVVLADGATLRGAPGERISVPAGATIRLGDRTLTVRPWV